METVKDVFDQFKLGLKDSYESHELTAVTQLVLSTLTAKSNAQLRAFPEYILPATQRREAAAVLAKLKNGIPVQYALGKADFCGLTFNVNPNVLIPRPETEELVSWILETTALYSWTAPYVIDIGTGSGCIAVTLKMNLAEAEVSALDISADALHTAKENASLNEVDVNFIQADILNLQQNQFTQKFNIIVSNPPYVTQTDKKLMHNRVTNFEPHTALFVPENNPLLFYHAIAKFALQYLKVDGLLFLEINESLGQQTVELLEENGFANVELRQDMFGRNRMIKASL